MNNSDFKKYLSEKLKDIDYAAGYLGECLKEGLYKMLSESGNPTLSSLSLILDNLGFEVKFTRKMEGTEAA